jgi:hypothetical protein
VDGSLEFDSDQESGSEIASIKEIGSQRSVIFLGSRISAIRSGSSSTLVAPKLSEQGVRRCKAAQCYAAYFVEHTSLKASTIWSLYECL